MADESPTFPGPAPERGLDVGRLQAANGTEIVFDAAGSGDPALVFVHGWAENCHHWNGQLGAFAGNHRVVRIDLAGHGDSGTARQDWSMSSFADDVVAVARSER
ncbi:MAG: alpha/beta fold hydrolase [Acidimicrobiia bacterium]